MPSAEVYIVLFVLKTGCSTLYFQIYVEFLPLQVLDFSITDLSSESDGIPDILDLDEEDQPDFSHANGPFIMGQRAE